MKELNLKRRDFVKVFGLASSGLILGCNLSGDKAVVNTLEDGIAFVPNLFGGMHFRSASGQNPKVFCKQYAGLNLFLSQSDSVVHRDEALRQPSKTALAGRGPLTS